VALRKINFVKDCVQNEAPGGGRKVVRSLFENQKHQIVEKFRQRPAKNEFSGEADDAEHDHEQDDSEQDTAEFGHRFLRCSKPVLRGVPRKPKIDSARKHQVQRRPRAAVKSK
jgi:hypothetical protein